MRPRFLTLFTFAAVLLLAGCQVWQRGTHFKTPDGVAAITIPTNWMFSTNAMVTKDAFLATKEGALLQRVVLNQHELKSDLPNSKRKLSPNLSPFEVAEAVVDDLRSSRELQALQVVENTPLAIDGMPGFRLVVEYGVAVPAGLKIREIRHGAVAGDKLYQLIYAAPARHYFDHYLPEFDAMAKTFSLAKK